jgi:branched-chain amino acid aminotransferase
MMTRAKLTGNYIGSVLAKKEAKSLGYDEAILLDVDGYVAEGSGENIFLVRNGKIKTTPLTSILPGITRDTVMTLAKDLGLEVSEQRFTRDEMYIADEMFFSGTAAEVTGIREIDGRKIGAGSMGPITQKIQSTYFDVIRGRAPRYQHWLDYYDLPTPSKEPKTPAPAKV